MLLQFIIKAATPEAIEAQAHAALEAGVNWIEICAPDSVSDDGLKSVVEKLRPELADKGAALIIGHRYTQAKDWKADGVHIYSSGSPISAVRVAVEAWPIIGANVADRSAAEALRPYDIDYLFFEADGSPEALETIRDIAAYLNDNGVETPLVCGGKISAADVREYAGAGAAAVATSELDSLEELLQVCRDITK